MKLDIPHLSRRPAPGKLPGRTHAQVPMAGSSGNRTEASLARLRDFVEEVGALLASISDERAILTKGSALLDRLVARDDWLPEDYAQPGEARYRQYLLHCDSRRRFSVASFVWGPGQSTPIHDHRVWGLVGVLRGAERIETFERTADGSLRSTSTPRILQAGEVDAVSPTIGDIHRVSNAFEDRVSISIHVYGANIGTVERAIYDADGGSRRFVSGYANAALPNLWRPAET